MNDSLLLTKGWKLTGDSIGCLSLRLGFGGGMLAEVGVKSEDMHLEIGGGPV